jgi:hypothetical protein
VPAPPEPGLRGSEAAREMALLPYVGDR